MKRYQTELILTCIVFIVAACKKEPVNYHPNVDAANFVSGINNKYFPLVPGTTFHYLNWIVEGHDTIFENIEVNVTHDTKVILGVTCEVIHDVVKQNGSVVEDTYDWYAQDKEGNVWYFGEDTKSWDNGVLSTEGSWTAGVNGAQPGIVMYFDPQAHIGISYRQEYLKGVAEDEAEVLNTNSNVSIAYGNFTNCVETKEFSNLESGVIEHKFYAEGVGQVLTETVKGENEREELISITQ